MFLVKTKFRYLQALAYEACYCTHTPLHTPKTLDVQKKHFLAWFKKLQGVPQIACLKQQRFLSFTFYKTQRSYEKIMCVYFLFHWFSGENCMFLFSLYKGRQTSKELKRKMNDGTIAFLTSLLIVLTWKILFLFSFRYKVIPCFK